MRAKVAPASVHMVYADPPFGNDQTWTGPAGSFSDRWRPSPESEAGWAALHAHSTVGAQLLHAASSGRGASARPYLGVMAGILIELRRVLAPIGTLWLHHDETMGAQLRVLGDVVFGMANGFGTIVWRRTFGAKATKRSFGHVHDTVAVWGRTRAARWRLWRCGSDLAHGDPMRERVFVDGICEERLTATARERNGYPTQKPVALIERFIRAATVPGDVVLDPTCGSGTTLAAAVNLGRRAIGIDVSEAAIATATRRVFANKAGARP